MTEITEGALTFSFPNGCEASKYDDWTFYEMRFQSVAGGSKAADILCLDRNHCCIWLIEIKDYRRHPRKKSSDLCDEVAVKMRDTLSGLAAAYANADVETERNFARQAIETGKWKVVLHLERPDANSRLRPKAMDPANVRLKLRQKLKAVDPGPVVMDMGGTLENNVPWRVREAQVVQQDE